MHLKQLYIYNIRSMYIIYTYVYIYIFKSVINRYIFVRISIFILYMYTTFQGHLYIPEHVRPGNDRLSSETVLSVTRQAWKTPP